MCALDLAHYFNNFDPEEEESLHLIKNIYNLNLYQILEAYANNVQSYVGCGIYEVTTCT